MDSIAKIIGIMSVNDTTALISLLKKNGFFVTQESSQKELLDSAFMGIKDSQSFRDDLANYLILSAKSSSVNASGYSNYVDSNFLNTTGVGDTLRTIFSQSNIDAVVKGGISVFSAKLQADATKGSEQRAIDYQTALAQTAAAQALAAQAQAKANTTATTTTASSKPSWVMPVVIIGSILLVGTVVYMVARKK